MRLDSLKENWPLVLGGTVLEQWELISVMYMITRRH
jgi:hypothetical protein